MAYRQVYLRIRTKGYFTGWSSDTLARNGIQPHCDKSVKNIINRAGTGFCPMEEAVEGLLDSNAALQAIREKLLNLSH